MSISKILNSLEKSWERDDILLNIKKGLGADEIVNEFLMKNEKQIKELNSLFRPEDIELLNQVEKLSTCESKLLNEIKNLNYLENNQNHHIINKKFNSLICFSFFTRNALTISSVPNPLFNFKRISSLSQDFSRESKILLMLILSIFTYDKLLFFSSVDYFFK